MWFRCCYDTHTHTHTHTHKLHVTCILTCTYMQIKTFSSLPNSYRNRAKMRETDIQRARSKEELPTRWTNQGSPHMGHHGERDYRQSPRVSRDHGSSPRVGNSPRGSFDQGGSPKVQHWRHRVDDETYRDEQRSEFTKNADWALLSSPLCFHSDPEWDEDAPPLPARNYSWSDIEDNDDEILQSDDDLDDEPLSKMSIVEHQKLYSSVSACRHAHNTITDMPTSPSWTHLLLQLARVLYLLDPTRFVDCPPLSTPSKISTMWSIVSTPYPTRRASSSARPRPLRRGGRNGYRRWLRLRKSSCMTHWRMSWPA